MTTPNRISRVPPAILAVLPLAYQDGRDCYAGFLQYLATHRLRWDIHLVREAISRAVFTRELARGVDGILFNGHQLDVRLAPLVPPHIPCVGLDAAHPEAFTGRAKVAFVDIDSDAIGRRGAEYLAAQGNYAAFGIVGYEINFNRYFYEYQPPRDLHEIDTELKAVEEEIRRILDEVVSA